MKNLTRKLIIPLALAGSILAGCATYPMSASTNKESVESKPVENSSTYFPEKGDKTINLRNGFYAESSFSADLIETITAAKTGEITIEKIGGNYKTKETKKYHTTPSREWNDAFNSTCSGADMKTPYLLVSDEEAWAFFQDTYHEFVRLKTLNEIDDSGN